jgi:AraC family transcriptional regulator, arabinose operon regulatory protein
MTIAPSHRHAVQPQAEADSDAGAGDLDNSYVLGHHGFIYTGSNLASGVTMRHPAVLLLSVNYAPFSLAMRDATPTRSMATLVPPLVARSLDARGVPLLSLNIMPSHEAFHVFRAMQHPGALALDRHAFNHLDAGFEALHRGEASIRDAEVIFKHAVTEALRHLPPGPTPDPRALELIRLLDANPSVGLEELARQFGYSQQVMARLFSSAVGMSMRDYQSWLKLRRVYDTLYSSRSLTQVALQAGFADSPQFSRTFQRWYGQSPSFSRDPKSVRVFIHGGSNTARGSPAAVDKN